KRVTEHTSLEAPGRQSKIYKQEPPTWISAGLASRKSGEGQKVLREGRIKDNVAAKSHPHRARFQKGETVMLSGFKKFLLRGNVVDMAVGIVIGAAFGTVVSSLVKDLLTPLIAAIVKAPDFSNLNFTFNHSKFLYGDFVNALVSFLIISAAVYFLVVLPINALIARVH